MKNIDLMVLRKLRDWRRHGYRAVLATVVRTWGSSPRPAGSLMAMNESGTVIGSVSGGCIEEDLVNRYTNPASDLEKRSSLEGPPKLVLYGLTAEHSHRFGLPCGGTLELLLEFDPDLNSLDELLSYLEAGMMVRRITILASGEVRIENSYDTPAFEFNDRVLVNTFGPRFRMLIIGAGQITDYLIAIANSCGFSVTVCDPRKEYSSTCAVSKLERDYSWPDDGVQKFRPDIRSCIVALSHDPRLDDSALIAALKTEAFYVGAIGSKRSQIERRHRLSQHFDVPCDVLDRLRAPVGMYIGSRTPPEIAVSIMADIIASKNGVPTELRSTPCHE